MQTRKLEVQHLPSDYTPYMELVCRLRASGVKEENVRRAVDVLEEINNQEQKWGEERSANQD